jgi:pyrroloquinoline quinone (PQQ) biosynthesis protein C
MDYVSLLNKDFIDLLSRFNNTLPIQRIQNCTINKKHYLSYLQEVAHFASNNPQIQALTTVYFQKGNVEATELFYRHAISEIGHDELALNDIAYLGGSAEAARNALPLPETMGLISFPFYQIQHMSAVGYLGYLYFLEFLPTTMGKGYLESLTQIGIPKEAMTFLAEHMTVDQGHNRLMEKYISLLIKSQSDYEKVVYSMNVTGMLYSRMIEAAFNRIDQTEIITKLPNSVSVAV